MADNVPITAGSGTSIAADDISSVWYQRVKISLGADGTAADCPGEGTNGMDVDPTRLPAGEVHLGEIGGHGVVVNATYTRPADTTAYAANDTVANSTSAPVVLTFTGMARVNAGTGYVVKARLLTSQTANVARFRLHLYKISPTAINDNAGCTAPLYADDAKYVGYVDFPAMQTGGGSPTAAFAQVDGLRLHFKGDTSDTNLYGLLQTLDVFTPANAQTFSCTLSAEND